MANEENNYIIMSKKERCIYFLFGTLHVDQKDHTNFLINARRINSKRKTHPCQYVLTLKIIQIYSIFWHT